MTLAAGSRLGPYQIVLQLGAGGMGIVYRAHDPRLDRHGGYFRLSNYATELEAPLGSNMLVTFTLPD